MQTAKAPSLSPSSKDAPSDIVVTKQYSASKLYKGDGSITGARWTVLTDKGAKVTASRKREPKFALPPGKFKIELTVYVKNADPVHIKKSVTIRAAKATASTSTKAPAKKATKKTATKKVSKPRLSKADKTALAEAEKSIMQIEHVRVKLTPTGTGTVSKGLRRPYESVFKKRLIVGNVFTLLKRLDKIIDTSIIKIEVLSLTGEPVTTTTSLSKIRAAA